ncbi:glycine/sarcosine/betaine reductase selenoprotein B family protein [Pseudonocardia xinjiangensis]|uniref:glycine/sarcosine/betaine reductase selenoprotein B family protein n=1 Tax=Pseudonocardia xinjiangensis TaxID=75289 RepID=UPI003D8D2DB4
MGSKQSTVSTGEPAMVTSPSDIGAFFDFDSKVAGPVLGIGSHEIPVFDEPQLTQLAVPLREATVGLLVTSGAYYPDQPRMRNHNDLSYRLLPRKRDLTEILFAHRTPVRAFALADPNVAYPRDTMVDLEKDGVFGRYADEAVSIVGSISKYDELATQTATSIVGEFERQGVDLLLVLPYCPQCHVAAGVLARAIERRGLPTTSLATLYKPAQSVKPPRATFLDFPLGCPGGRPNRPDQQRAIVRAALETGASTPIDTPWSLGRLPFTWDEDGNRAWEELVTDVYRVDNEIRGTVLANLSEHTDNLSGKEREFAIRCAC